MDDEMVGDHGFPVYFGVVETEGGAQQKENGQEKREKTNLHCKPHL
jgi:hypothetical protein